MTVADAVVVVLVAAGILGALVPFLPGTPLILAGAVVHAIAHDFVPVGAGRLALLAVLATAGWGLEHLAAAMGTRGAGGSRAAVIGALAGTVVGVAFAPLGLLVGPIVGAIGGELLAGRSPAGSVRTGIGTALGVVAGVVAHLVFALAMAALLAWWIWTGT